MISDIADRLREGADIIYGNIVYMNPDGRLTTKKIPVEYDLMSFDRIVTQVPSKSDGGRLIKITGSVCIHQPALQQNASNWVSRANRSRIAHAPKR